MSVHRLPPASEGARSCGPGLRASGPMGSADQSCDSEPDVVWQTTRTRLGKLWEWADATQVKHDAAAATGRRALPADVADGFHLPPPAPVFGWRRTLLEQFVLQDDAAGRLLSHSGLQYRCPFRIRTHAVCTCTCTLQV